MCLPITVDHLKVVQRFLDLSTRDYVMWALCCVGIFFLQVGEFTVNCVFNPVTHMTVGDLQADSLVNSSCFKVLIKCSKVEPFCLGCDVYLKWGKA